MAASLTSPSLFAHARTHDMATTVLSMAVDASCAICGRPSSQGECAHEGERLELAFNQAMARWGGMDNIRCIPLLTHSSHSNLLGTRLTQGILSPVNGSSGTRATRSSAPSKSSKLLARAHTSLTSNPCRVTPCTPDIQGNLLSRRPNYTTSTSRSAAQLKHTRWE